MKTMELGVYSTFFLKQIHGGAAGVGCVWRRKFGVELFFWIWSCVELSQTRPKSICGSFVIVCTIPFISIFLGNQSIVNNFLLHKIQNASITK
jgi:hypothetical protein